MACSIRRVRSDSFWYEGETEVGNGLNFSARLHKKLTERNFVNMSGSLQFSRKGLKPGFETSLGTYLDRQTVGYLRYSTSLGSDWNHQLEVVLTVAHFQSVRDGGQHLVGGGGLQYEHDSREGNHQLQDSGQPSVWYPLHLYHPGPHMETSGEKEKISSCSEGE